eukprot:6170276-Prymnesium_polylepis.1
MRAEQRTGHMSHPDSSPTHAHNLSTSAPTNPHHTIQRAPGAADGGQVDGGAGVWHAFAPLRVRSN